ncbi:hypothetical protein J31TS4_24590 [Paenibacillus sp. J31TS4]|uniref:uroporphyrinogen-III C-methyltransferase n=1 Tax=Paenibacillus sp. J31TS4 TaxID=2807195 RepID=UPI001B030F95|nr:uroporphyrinogen-III C-methyltransferase [Paenibacillus sp. J31TS4]GIP39179.1 hypothetical protein J31TS4_24590 [Paenibacillus sp. J31TS4]
MGKGKVYLVGAGPGDAKLITVRGLEAIRKADAVVYDRLANPMLLKHMKPGAERIYVGKLPDRHTLRQEVISRMLVDLALEGKTVTRLKGGDPSVFGRVGEEAELLAEHGIPFELVPGITSAIAVPAYAGIPVTHRDFTSSLAIVTGHECPKADSSIDWGKLSTATGTLIFLMGVSNVKEIRDVLIANGKPSTTPVAAIRWGTTPEQETLVGTLETIVGQVEQTGFRSPAVIIVGDVVRLREKLAWFERKPLFGKRIVVTRARSQASELADRIEELGGEALELPVIRLQPPSDPARAAKLDEAIKSAASYDWLIFTSVNGVDFFFERMKELRVDIRALGGAQLAAVGPKTAEALAARGLYADALPASFQQEGLADALLGRMAAGQRVLFPRANLARDVLTAELRARGIEVTEVDAYENVLEDSHGSELLDRLRSGEVHMVTFASSSTVRNLLQLLRQAGSADPAAELAGTEIVCIGPVTAQTAREAGLPVHRMAKESTIDAMVEAMLAPDAPAYAEEQAID